MEPWLETFFMLWEVVFPILGIFCPAFLIAFWRCVVPSVARRLTWARFGKATVLAIADDDGWVELVVSRKSLGEGVLETSRGWRLLPRPYFKKIIALMKKKPKKGSLEASDPVKLEQAENIVLRRFSLRGLGKPFWYGYAGKAPLMSPKALSELQRSKEEPLKEQKLNFIQKVKKYIDEKLPREYAEEMTNILDQLRDVIKARTLTLVDPTLIKQVISKTYNQSQLDALATNREMRGMKRAGKQFMPFILGGAIIVAIVAMVIIVMVLK